MIKVKDFQFINFLLTNEIYRPNSMILLEKEIKLKYTGEPDVITDQGSRLIYQNPSSVTMFIFHTLYHLLSQDAADGMQKDKLGLGLLYMCKKYVYEDIHTIHSLKPGPPVIVDFHKSPVPSAIINEIVEPIAGTIPVSNVLFSPCKFTDTCRIVESLDQLESEYNLPKQRTGYHEFPLVLCNCNIHNSAAQLAHLTAKSLENSVGRDKADKIIRTLLGNEGSITSNLILVLKTLKGEPKFVLDFLQFLRSNVSLKEDETDTVLQNQATCIEADSYLQKHIIKIANPSTGQIDKQWSQWSMLMGLIEKQLEPMRGSMWPASENVKPHEDRFRLMIKEKADKKKSQVNFEELLETARDLYDHNAVEPGKLIEVMLKKDRVWKQ